MSITPSVSKFISTVCCIGKIPYCPGTFGSLAAYPISWIISHFISTSMLVFSFDGLNFREQQIINLILLHGIVCIFLLIVGIYTSSIYVADVKKEDPKEVVIDEVVGQLLVITLCILPTEFLLNANILHFSSPEIVKNIFGHLLPFVLFRLFDILKPWPINWLDKNIKGGLGIMVDDVLAAVFAAISLNIIIFLIIDWFQ